MSTAVQICSNALLMLGDKPINSLSEDPNQATSDRELAAANLYPQVRNATLRAHPWNCATKRVVLSPDSQTPAFDWAYQFLLPGDWLRTLGVSEGGCRIDFRAESGRILADSSSLELLYIYRNENPATWDSLLVDAVTTAMAARLAIPVTNDRAKKVEMEGALLRLLQQARGVDGQDSPPEEFGDSPFLLARF
ncbi:hypothetical protein [Lysobacter sp. ESA13C]|uniref:hypothetical protein n=1 Tax=Lysobacter sp. ESA13C TaxID=2862676 RepID=UPI001CBBC5C2|nr:hypothetical protein [Lysobacter sp. ESA13C]